MLGTLVGSALAFVGVGVEAQPPPAAFTAVQSADDDRQRLVRVDKSVLEVALADAKRGAARLTIDMGGGAALQAVVQHTAATRTGYSLSGRIVSGGSITWVVDGGRVTGTIWTPVAVYDVLPQSGGMHALRKVDHAAALPLGEPLAVSTDRPRPVQRAQADSDDGSRADVLVLWTPAARRAAGGESAMRAAIDLYVATANDALRNSGTNLQIRLVGADEVAYTEALGASGTDLRRLRGATDGHMDAIHARRDALRADLVSLITSNIDVGGIAFQMDDPSVGFAPNAFSVVVYSTAPSLGAMAFAHELGHNMGLAHDRFVAPQGGAFPFGRGYVNAHAFAAGADADACWYTLMAYHTRCRRSGFGVGTRVPFFSTPRLRYPAANGHALGVAKTSDVAGHDGPADAALAIDRARLAVANFRAEERRADDGDTIATATAVPASSSATLFAELGADDVDYFRIQLAQASSLRVASEGSSDTVGALLSAEGVTLASDDDSGDWRNFLIERALPPGTYYIKVTGHRFAAGRYALVVRRRSTGVADDHGDTAASATIVPVPSTTAVTLADAGDVDYFRFELTERRLVEATTSGTVDTTGSLRLNGDLFKDVVCGDETVVDDDSGAAGNFKIAGKFDPGIYHLAVAGSAGAQGATTLKMSLGAGADDHGDSPDDATGLSLPARVAGELEALFDWDYFRIAVPARGLLRLRSEGGTNTLATLTAANGRVLAKNDDDPYNWPNFGIGVRVEPGVYTLRVRGWHLTIGPYLLTASFDAAPVAAQALADLDLAAGATTKVDLSAAFRDPGGTELAYAIHSSAESVAGATVRGTTLRVAARSVGEATVTVRAKNRAGLGAAQSFAVTVRQRSNGPPLVERKLADLTLAPLAGAMVDVAGAFGDPEGADLAYSATSSLASVASVAVQGRALLAVAARSAGKAAVTVTATDPDGLAATQSFAVTVVDVARPTVGSVAPLQLAAHGESAQVNLAAAFGASPGGAPLAFSAKASAPLLASARVADARLIVTANAGGEVGTLTVLVTATDRRGLAATLAIPVEVWAVQRLLRGWRMEMLARSQTGALLDAAPGALIR